DFGLTVHAGEETGRLAGRVRQLGPGRALPGLRVEGQSLYPDGAVEDFAGRRVSGQADFDGLPDGDPGQVLFQHVHLDPDGRRVPDLEEVFGQIHHLTDPDFAAGDDPGDGAEDGEADKRLRVGLEQPLQEAVLHA